MGRSFAAPPNCLAFARQLHKPAERYTQFRAKKRRRQKMGLLDKLFAKRRHRRASLLNIQGIQLAKRGSYKEAHELFEQAIEMSPDLPHPRISLSNILLRDGRYSQAELQLKKALELNPDNKTQQDAWNNLASIRFEQKRYSEAIALLKKAISVYKPDHEIFYNIAISFEQLGEWEVALDYFNRSSEALTNSKAETGIKRVKQRMWQSRKMDQILNSYKGFDIEYPICGDGRLTSDELEKVEKVKDASLVFFVGAGISYPWPSCLPMASQMLRQVFHLIFELDKQEIYEILQISTEITKDEAYARLSRDLLGIPHEVSDDKCSLPFEATFQALHDVLGFPVIRFVDLLKRGKPNLHHKMLAYALYKGHTVITTNFDKHIEYAYATCFPGESLQILVTDKDYQESIDNNRTNSVLAKIHGDMDDYNSLALTLQGVAVSCDRTMYLGDDIDKEKGKQQLQWIHPRTALSIPKALFLQRVLQDRKIVVMGYSGSDIFDIMPILTASEFRCSGLWVEHTSEPLSPEVDQWKCNGENRDVLQPKAKAEMESDITSRVSKYFLDVFSGSWQEESVDNGHIKSLSSAFESWIEGLRLQPGDGLCCLARLYSQRGKWSRTKLFYTKAMGKYEKDLEHNEWRWLVTKSNLGYILDNLNQKDRALKVLSEIKEYIEDGAKQRLYPSLYANTLIDIAGKWINTLKDIEAGEMVNKAMGIAQGMDGTEGKKILCYGLRLAADRYLGKKEYKEALDIYLRVVQLSSDIFGDIREACLSSMHAGICLANMGARYEAIQMLMHAEAYAKHLGDEQLINAVKHNQGFVDGQFVGMSPALNFHAELVEAAKKQIDDSDANLDELLQYIGFEQYDQSLGWINKLLTKYDHPDARACLLFLKSNIYHRTQRLKEEIEILKEFCKIKPRHPLAEHNLGIAYSSLKNYDMAERHYLKAIELMGGNYPLANCNLGIMYTEMGRLEAAKEELLKAKKSNAPEDTLNALRRRIAQLEEPKKKWGK